MEVGLRRVGSSGRLWTVIWEIHRIEEARKQRRKREEERPKPEEGERKGEKEKGRPAARERGRAAIEDCGPEDWKSEASLYTSGLYRSRLLYTALPWSGCPCRAFVPQVAEVCVGSPGSSRRALA